MSHKTCRVCDARTDAEVFTAREKMFGTQEAFEYFQCAGCGCLQIADIPSDLGSYYPSNYYSFSAAERTGWRAWLSLQRNRAALGGGSWIGRRLVSAKPNPPLQSLAGLGLGFDARIGDVGCGAGVLLRDLQSLGFEQLMGIDPNIERDVQHGHGLLIRKCRLEDVSAQFDLLMFHHSLEHIPDQRATLAEAWAHLRPGGACIVRVPLVSSEAWRRYRLDWVQLDAPRHLYLHSARSMGQLAARTGFVVERTVHDSNEFQFWGSEALKRGLPLVDPATGLANPQTLQIARDGRRRWRSEAEDLNRRAEGDQAIFVLRKPSEGQARTA